MGEDSQLAISTAEKTGFSTNSPSLLFCSSVLSSLYTHTHVCAHAHTHTHTHSPLWLSHGTVIHCQLAPWRVNFLFGWILTTDLEIIFKHVLRIQITNLFVSLYIYILPINIYFYIPPAFHASRVNTFDNFAGNGISVYLDLSKTSVLK